MGDQHIAGHLLPRRDDFRGHQRPLVLRKSTDRSEDESICVSGPRLPGRCREHVTGTRGARTSTDNARRLLSEVSFERLVGRDADSQRSPVNYEPIT